MRMARFVNTFTHSTPRSRTPGPPLKYFASSGKSVGDGEGQRAVAVRNRRNFLQVESKDLC
jgi:hypothetical protein